MTNLGKCPNCGSDKLALLYQPSFTSYSTASSTGASELYCQRCGWTGMVSGITTDDTRNGAQS